MIIYYSSYVQMYMYICYHSCARFEMNDNLHAILYSIITVRKEK